MAGHGRSTPVAYVSMWALLGTLSASSVVSAVYNKQLDSYTNAPNSQVSAEQDFATGPLPMVNCTAGDPNQEGLVCKEEGYYITKFNNTIYWSFDDDQGALMPVPAADAICCRLTVPKSLPHDPSGVVKLGDKPVGIISVGCHSSTNTGNETMECELDSESFISGFQGARSTINGRTMYIPVDSPVCCTPVLLLSSGDAWELKRCDCTPSNNVSCHSRFLWGYEYCRHSDGHYVPMIEALCCKVCLGKKIHDMSKCADLNNCSNQGVCIMGACSCRAGFSGSDCRNKTGNNEAWWQSFWWLGVIGFMCAFTGLFATFWMIQRAEWADHTQNRGDADDPLLHWVDVEGSVGSEDTTNSDKSGEISSMTPSMDGEHIDGLSNHSGEQTEEPSLSQPQANLTPAGIDRLEASGTMLLQDTDTPARGSQEIEAEDSPDDGELEKPGDGLPDTQPVQKTLLSKNETGPLSHLICSVCMNRPVQVALVPCGHSNLCRKCSRKLQSCPFCRKEIVRRQRLFLSG